jgi:glycine cleavage system H protein
VNPSDLRYTTEHEWISPSGDNLRIGITDYAQEALGDIVFVTLPAVGTTVTAGQSFGGVESTKSVSEVYAPFDGTVTARNDALDANPEIVNGDPYGEGWLVEVTPAAGVEAALSQAGLLDAGGYAQLVGESDH